MKLEKHSLKRDSGIIALRTLAMLMIVLCHVCIYLQAPTFLPQFLNAGVFVFLLISGWLYSDKVIAVPLRWLFERWKKLCIPILIWVLSVWLVSVCFYHQTIGKRDLLLFFSNLQGMSWILPSFPRLSGEGLVSGLEHLWFITVIFCCYILLCFRFIKQNSSIVCLILFSLSICLGLMGINLFYLACFFLGCALKKFTITRNRVFVATIIAILAVMIRLGGRHFLDGTVYYNVIIVSMTQILICVWLFVSIKWLVDNYSIAKTIADSRLVRKGDQFSYHIYITHYLFLCPFFGLRHFIPSTILQIVVFAALTLLSAIALKWISDKSIKCISKSS